jgi:hypothetical protein
MALADLVFTQFEQVIYVGLRAHPRHHISATRPPI